jgi:hypothetical protein
MMDKPTYEDATLLIQLSQFAVSSGAQEAISWMWSHEFVPEHTEFLEKYPPGSEGHLKAYSICSYFETIGTLYRHGLLNETLLFDWLAVSLIWDRIKRFPLEIRLMTGEPRLYENFEAMAKAQAEHDARPPND